MKTYQVLKVDYVEEATTTTPDFVQFVDNGEGLFYDSKEKSTLKIHEYLANNDPANFKLKRNNKIIKVKLHREKYSDDQTKKIEYFIAQGLRFRNFSEFDEEILFPNILKKESTNLRKEYETKKNSYALNNLSFTVPAMPLIRKPFIIEKPCPKDVKGWGCWGYQTMKRFINGTAISYCGVANGSLPKEDFWSFAVEHAKNKFPSESRNKARQDIVDLYYSDRFIVQKSAKNLINKAGGCAYLLKDNYPSLYRDNTGDDSNAPSLQETMQDTPFEW